MLTVREPDVLRFLRIVFNYVFQKTIHAPQNCDPIPKSVFEEKNILHVLNIQFI
jgi:hypothetical protein